MRKILSSVFVVGMVVIAASGLAASRTLPEGVTPAMATWRYGDYAIPSTFTKTGDIEKFRASPGDPLWTTSAEKKLKPGVKVPVVLYLHGCGGLQGISHDNYQYQRLLLAQGYAVFMPDSFKRPGRRKCREEGDLRHRVYLRTEEVKYALDRIRELPWVDQKRIILMGFSEGGNTTDNWSRAGFVAHIIIGSACTLLGDNPAAPEGVPVLAIVGEYDEFRPGMTCKVKRTVGGSKSIIIPGAPHHIARYTQTQEAIKVFLSQCCSCQERPQVPPKTWESGHWLLGEWVGIRESRWSVVDATIRITSYDPASREFKGDGRLVNVAAGASTDLVVEGVIDDKGRVVMTTHHHGGRKPGRIFTFNLKRKGDTSLYGMTAYGPPSLSLKKKR